MRPLFTSNVCDHCDGLNDYDLYSGFIVHRSERVGTDAPFYVFPNRTAAAIWRAANGSQALPIREVFSLQPFHWIQSKGSLDVELADSPYTIFSDHKHPAGPRRAFIEPMSRTRAA